MKIALIKKKMKYYNAIHISSNKTREHKKKKKKKKKIPEGHF